MTKPTFPQRVATTLNIAAHHRKRSPHAFGVLTFTTIPNTNETVQIAYRLYRITKGADLATTIATLAAAITADSMAVVSAVSHDATTIEVEAKRGGWGGAGIALSTNATGASWGSSSLTYEAV